ncbi:MAG: PorV/PorQ family protein [Elusimicrobia bacterium]|nr:PorV/PorQ family protein [Elusimicrobiota bacterium]
MMTRTASLLLAAALFFARAHAYGAGPGTSAASFLNLGFGARVTGLGEAVMGIADDVSTVYYNPAGLAFNAPVLSDNRPYEAVVAHSLYLQDIRVTQFGLLKRPYAVHLTQVGVKGIERRTSETAAPEGTFGASDLSLSVSHGRKFGGFGLGVTGRLIRQQIGERSASAYAMDLGFLHRFESRPFSVGLGIMNLGTSVKFVEEAYPLPTVLRAGVTYGLTKRFPHALNAQLDMPRDGAPVMRLSFEYLGFGPFTLRAGYRTQSSAQKEAAVGKALGSAASGLSEFYGMFMGVGFRSKLGGLDYSITPYGELGSAHRFSISMRFGKGGAVTAQPQSKPQATTNVGGPK